MQSSIKQPLRLLATLALTLLLGQCSAPISVKRIKPEIPLAKDVTVTAGSLLAEIRRLAPGIARGDATAMASYNSAVARLVEQIERDGLNPWARPEKIQASYESFVLRANLAKDFDPLRDNLIAADTLKFTGDYAKTRSTVTGIGAPLVAVSSIELLGHTETRKHLPLRNLTAMVRIQGTQATLELVDPYQVDSVHFSGRHLPLSADYGAAMMYGMSKVRIDKLGLTRLLRPSKYDDTAHLNFIQPYDPKRIPILCVHGLQDTPVTFAPMMFKLLEDPEIRKHYQFWVFSYPSGYPYPYSASLLRRELDQVYKDFPNHRKMVIMGHSMGGIISRLMVTNVGDKLWVQAMGKTPEKTPIYGRGRELLLSTLVFENRREIDRAIFISAPHRGSILASNWFGRMASRLVRLPSFIADVKNTAISLATVDAANLMLDRAPNSIDTLSPNNWFVRQINHIPISPGVPYHTIFGDRGKGDAPNGSDGVVPHWSSHIEGAASEKVVPSGHSAHQNSQGIEEVRRILHLHLRKVP